MELENKLMITNQCQKKNKNKFNLLLIKKKLKLLKKLMQLKKKSKKLMMITIKNGKTIENKKNQLKELNG